LDECGTKRVGALRQTYAFGTVGVFCV